MSRNSILMFRNKSNIFFNKIIYLFEKTNYPFVAACLFFLFSALFIAGFVSRGMPPDEAWHIGIIQYYAANSWLPIINQQSDTFFIGDITRISSYLYHYLFSFYYRILELFNVADSIFLLRLPNVFIALGSLVTLKKIAEQLKLKKLAINLGVIFVINIPMFIFLSGSVNYDNLAILFALLITLYTIKLRDDSSDIRKYLILIILWSAGLLTKFVLLPVVAASGTIAFFYLIRGRKNLWKNIKKINLNLGLVGLVLFSVVALGFAAERYGYNYLAHESFQPRCDEIHEFDQCMDYGIFQRSYLFNQNPPATDERVSPPEYFVTWSKIMFERTYGVLGHAPYQVNALTFYSALGIFIVLAVAAIRKVDRENLKQYAIPALIFLAYFAALIYRNHGSYQNRNMITLAVQGRYLFIVLFPMLLIGMNYATELGQNKYFKVALIGIIVLASAINGLPSLLYGLENYWSDSLPEQLRLSLL